MKVTEHISPEHTGSNIKTAMPFFQPKLSVNTPGDAYEHEADAMAAQVMRMQIPQKKDAFFSAAISAVQRKCAACEEEDKHIHRKENSNSEAQGNPELDNYVSSLSSSGQQLSESSRHFFEPRFGQDFSTVKIHTDSVAAKSAQSINALAYTTGNNIVFNEGQYSPDSESGQRLMAHELTHVMQQGAKVQPKLIQRASKGMSAKCTDPLIIPDTKASIPDPISVITLAEKRAIVLMDQAINILDSTRQRIVAGAPAGSPTVSDSLAQAIRLLACDPNSDAFWKNSGLRTADLILRRLRAIRGSIASGGFFYTCLGSANGKVGTCEGPICGASGRANEAVSCAGSGQIQLCSPFWEEGSEAKADTIMHEASHNFAGFIQDKGREGNAACYSRFVLVVDGISEGQRADLCPDA